MPCLFSFIKCKTSVSSRRRRSLHLHEGKGSNGNEHFYYDETLREKKRSAPVPMATARSPDGRRPNIFTVGVDASRFCWSTDRRKRVDLLSSCRWEGGQCTAQRSGQIASVVRQSSRCTIKNRRKTQNKIRRHFSEFKKGPGILDSNEKKKKWNILQNNLNVHFVK